MYKERFKKPHFFFHMAYLCRAWEDSCDFTLDMLKCNTEHTTIGRKHLHQWFSL